VTARPGCRGGVEYLPSYCGRLLLQRSRRLRRRVGTVPDVPYTDLYFGMSDSKNEVNEDPENFVRSFVDLSNATGASRPAR